MFVPGNLRHEHAEATKNLGSGTGFAKTPLKFEGIHTETERPQSGRIDGRDAQYYLLTPAVVGVSYVLMQLLG
jgi:hypothetical protein